MHNFPPSYSDERLHARTCSSEKSEEKRRERERDCARMYSRVGWKRALWPARASACVVQCKFPDAKPGQPRPPCMQTWPPSRCTDDDHPPYIGYRGCCYCCCCCCRHDRFFRTIMPSRSMFPQTQNQRMSKFHEYHDWKLSRERERIFASFFSKLKCSWKDLIPR